MSSLITGILDVPVIGKTNEDTNIEVIHIHLLPDVEIQKSWVVMWIVSYVINVANRQ